MPKPLHVKSYPPIDEKVRRKIIALYQESGLNIRQLAVRYAGIVSEDAISRTLHEADVKVATGKSGAM